MPNVPKEPEAFTEHVARSFRKLYDRSTIHITGPLEMTVDDRVVGLEDLYRAFLKDDSKVHEMIAEFVEAVRNVQMLEETPLPLEVVRTKVMPRIHGYGVFRSTRPELIAHQPYINDTVILYMVELNGAATPVTTEQLIRWGIGLDDLDAMARTNLAGYRPNLELQLFQGAEGAAALFNTGDGYDASRLLLDRLYPQLAPEFGGNFLVAIPARDIFIAFPKEPDNFVHRLQQRIDDDYRSMPYPITNDLFLVTLDGVADWKPAA
ncbi:MAG: DUF1444 family protein [Planctomycetes bacterium]|nr:DUF1444 family protein [Planctomycetota bacterium]